MKGGHARSNSITRSRNRAISTFYEAGLKIGGAAIGVTRTQSALGQPTRSICRGKRLLPEA
jgi:hypothetical protein